MNNEEKSKTLNGNRVMRNERGQLMKGFTANPFGKPKGAKHFSTLLHEAIIKISEGDSEPVDVLIVKKVLQMARRGDMRAIELVFDRVDGKCSQLVAMEVKDSGLTDEQKKKLDDML